MQIVALLIVIAVLWVIIKLIIDNIAVIIAVLAVIVTIYIIVKAAGSASARKVIDRVVRWMLLFAIVGLGYFGIAALCLGLEVSVDEDAWVIRDVVAGNDPSSTIPFGNVSYPVWMLWGLILGTSVGIAMALARTNRKVMGVLIGLALGATTMAIGPIAKARLESLGKMQTKHPLFTREIEAIEQKKKAEEEADNARRQREEEERRNVIEPINDRIVSATASSSWDIHPPEHAFDGRPDTAWNHKGNKKSPPAGQWLAAEFNAPMRIRRIVMATGWDYISKKKVDLFKANSHVKKVRIEFEGGGSAKQLEFEASTTQKMIDVSSIDIVAKRVTLTFVEVWKGKKWSDMCISDVSFFGGMPLESSNLGAAPERSVATPTPEPAPTPAAAPQAVETALAAAAAVPEPVDIPDAQPDQGQARKHLQAGRELESSGNHSAALEEYKLAVAYNPDLAWAWGEMSYSLNKLERFREALSAAENAVRLGGDGKMLGAAYFNIGDAQEELGNPKGAIAAFEKSLEKRPGHPYVTRRLEALLARQ